jgi:hypothetical protein
MAPDFLCAILFTLHSPHSSAVVADAFGPTIMKIPRIPKMELSCYPQKNLVFNRILVCALVLFH